jgi:hypothetical protein
MPGALNLTEPKHLLAKLEHELQAVSADRSNSFAAINALRDAYHLREWIWHDRLENDVVLRTAIMSTPGDEPAWNSWVKQQFPEFEIVRELCNGSKHFTDRAAIRATHRAGWDSKVFYWDTPGSSWDDNGFYVEIDTGKIVAVLGLIIRVRDFWANLFQQFAQLG